LRWKIGDPSNPDPSEWAKGFPFDLARHDWCGNRLRFGGLEEIYAGVEVNNANADASLQMEPYGA
jgi:hypothetical protein